ncbi:DUF2284 domain-containing protein [Anaeromicrobium sediminis]|uniref:Metal-binding protein n=1 Tax=Anaeromicrobium sediminis TaxID=1478221 RepID=A0A267MDH7_9FIRM|nr:DUF2284 domain-containing protein [Anaeromicrobium sediminis]PAB57517.1 hypothetical protein CCE28_18610 [Anaeromicrobium sediminis]
MNYVKNMEHKIKEITMKDLKKYYNPEEVLGYCANCNNHEKIWSCPPYDFNVDEYINKYEYAYIIGSKIYLKGHKGTVDEINELSLEILEDVRGGLDKKIIKEEDENNVVLYAGRCIICKDCTRIKNKACIKPDKMRYSLESLGFKVSEITSGLLKEEILWAKESLPEYFLLVSAIFSKEKIKDEKIDRLLNTLKNY